MFDVHLLKRPCTAYMEHVNAYYNLHPHKNPLEFKYIADKSSLAVTSIYLDYTSADA